jgi:antitoxin CptB
MKNELNSQRIKWACRRGMLELDLILLPFFNAHYDQLSIREQQLFVKLLEYPDPELYDYLISGYRCDEPDLQPLFDKIRNLYRS